MAQKIVAVITKTKSFMESIEWNNLRMSIACNGDRRIPKDDYEGNPNGTYCWEFPNDPLPTYRHFNNIHEAIELGWRLLAPPVYTQGYLRKHDTYEWWLTKD